MRLKELGEFGLIERLAGGTIFRREGLERGIGDDAAVLVPTPGKKLLLTADMLVAGVHFVREAIAPADLGYKALAVSLSDIAAMGGTPRQALVSVGWDEQATVEEAEAIYAGMKELAGRWQVNLIGGDTVQAPVLVLDVTVLGEAEPEAVFYRSGARVGDRLCVTGSLGKAAAGLALVLRPELRARVPAAVEAEALAAHYRPLPRLAAAAALAVTGGVHALLDVSDGLASEVNHICRQSGTGARLQAEKVPLAHFTRVVAAAAGEDPLEWALHGGEDYELLLAASPEAIPRLVSALAATGTTLTEVGEIVPAEEGLRLALPTGEVVPLAARGYNHFLKDTCSG